MYLYDVKQFYIIYRICEANEVSFVTSMSLAEELGITSKTIKYMISSMSDYATDHGFSISSKKGSGYSISIIDKKLFLPFRKRLYDYFNKYNPSILQHDTRVMFLLLYLLQASDPVSINTLTKLFYVSSSTLYNDINKAKKVIHSLTICSGNKVVIDENELTKRNKICLLYNDFLFSDGIVELFDDPFYLHYQKRLSNSEECISLLSNALNAYNISVSNEALELLLTYCFLSDQRFQLKKHLAPISNDNLKQLQEYLCSEAILHSLHLTNANDENEISSLALLLLIYNNNHFNSPDRYKAYHDRLQLFVNSLTDQLDQRFSGAFKTIPYIDIFLFQIFTKLFFALEFNIEKLSFDNLTFRSEITTNQVIIEFARYLTEIILLETGKKLSYSMIHMISLVFEAIFITVPDPETNIHLLVVPKESEIFWPFIMKKIERLLPYKTQISFSGKYQLNDIKYSDFDILVTDYPSLQTDSSLNIPQIYYDFREDYSIELMHSFYQVYNRKNYNYRYFIQSFKHIFIHRDYIFDGIASFLEDLYQDVKDIVDISKEYISSKNNMLNYYSQNKTVIIPNITNNMGSDSVLSVFQLLPVSQEVLWREREISLIIFINFDINNDFNLMKKLVKFVDYILKHPEWQRHIESI